MSDYEIQVNTVFNVFEKLENTTKLYEKEELLKTIKDLYVFKKIIYIVYSDEIKTYYSYKRLLTFPCGVEQKATFEDFMELVGLLSKRTITGKEADEYVKGFFLNCDKFHCKWYKRILAKDLKINIGINIINAVYDEKIIDKFISPMLAFNIRNIKNPQEFINKHDWIYEEKIDGIRCLSFFSNGVMQCYSRNGKRLKGAEDYLKKHITENTLKELDGYILDGEFYSKNWSNTMTSVFNSNPDESVLKGVEYNIFDIIPIDKYKTKRYNLPLKERKKLLKNKFIKAGLRKPFRFIPFNTLSNKDIKNIFTIAERYIHKGFEGIILKDINSPYISGRNKSWIKIKDIKTIDVLCVDVEKSYFKKDEISALIFKYKGKLCKVGTGLTDEQRKLFFKNPNLVIGKIIEIQYQEESKDGCLRFPVFIRIREDKEIPDA